MSEIRWLEFLTFASRLTGGVVAFRGQKDFSWTLMASVGRPDIHPGGRFSPTGEQDLLEGFKREAWRHFDARGFTAMDWAATAQHYALPTRLLDWTFNPLAAAWFACQSELKWDGSARSDADGAVFAIVLPKARILSTDDPYRPTSEPFYFVRVPEHATRITAQSGLFSVHPDPTVEIELSTLRELVPVCAKFRIMGAEKAYFLDMLARMGVDQGRLMVDLDGVSKSIVRAYQR